jgi:methionyl-tRNA formyltransferase
MALGMDEGDILVQESWDITAEDTTGSLFARTGERGGPLLMEAMKGLIDNTITPIRLSGMNTEELDEYSL